MNAWLAGAAVLLGGIAPCGWVAMRGTRLDALVALELATTLTTLASLRSKTARQIATEPPKLQPNAPIRSGSTSGWIEI